MECFSHGDGNETTESENSPSKMQAVHSSSALSVNIFQYWQNIGQISKIASACGFPKEIAALSQKIVFEDKYKIDKRFQFSPNIDVVFHNSGVSQIRRLAIECKFTEAYRTQRHAGLKTEYFQLDNIWTDIPSIFEFARTISPEDDRFEHLHPAQLIKHILGLKELCGREGFILLYLWYDVPGKEGVLHREEIDTFTNIIRQDGVEFHSMSYQELIVILSNEYRLEHNKYIKYISERYL
jgi:hypothetical protein